MVAEGGWVCGGLCNPDKKAERGLSELDKQRATRAAPLTTQTCV